MRMICGKVLCNVQRAYVWTHVNTLNRHVHSTLLNGVLYR